MVRSSTTHNSAFSHCESTIASGADLVEIDLTEGGGEDLTRNRDSGNRHEPQKNDHLVGYEHRKSDNYPKTMASLGLGMGMVSSSPSGR